MKIILTSFAILAVVGTAAAIKCFVCNSEQDSACGDKLNADSPALMEAFIQECEERVNETAPFCRKTKEYMETKTVNLVRVHRECGYKRRPKYDCYQKRAEDYIQDVCQCDDVDNCNGAHAFTPLAPLLLLSMPLVARFM